MAPKRKPLKRRTRPSALRRWAAPLKKWVLRASVLAALALAALTGWFDLKVRSDFEGKRWAVPARLYAKPLTLYPDQTIARSTLLAELKAAGYTGVKKTDRPGQYAAGSKRIDIYLRPFRFWDGEEPGQQVSIDFTGSRIARIRVGGKNLPLLRLEPALIGRIYPHHKEDRILKKLEHMPQALVTGLLAVEDRHFYDHAGISVRGIARALLANIMAGAAVQGGSTLTQQLAKNFFLTSERTLWRKSKEALIALILEARYDKRTILNAYMNEIYLGQQGNNGIHGFGSAAWLYFGRPVEELKLHECALLVGLARGASYYNPRRYPKRALKRRNLVLAVMADNGVITPAQAKAAKARSLGLKKGGVSPSSTHPAFMELVRAQLQRDYASADLTGEGLRIFTTLEPSTQKAAETALENRLAKLERAKKLPPGKLEGAVVVAEPTNGQILAVVGSRNPQAHGFNRALAARRAIGSLVKPAVYLTALEERRSLDSLIDDAPIAVRLPEGRTWRPNNYDGRSRGTVPLRDGLVHSLNQATVRLGLELGVARVARTLKALGVARSIQPVPSILLGTVEGFKVPLRVIRAVTHANSAPLKRYALDVHQAVKPAAIGKLRTAMVEVMERGTARYAHRTLPKHMRMAGKTGTTDNLRDSWFAGFGADKLAVVWIGRDDNRPAGLSGSNGALRVWTDLMAAVKPRPLPAGKTPIADAGVENVALDERRGQPAGGCEGDLLGGFIQSLLGSGCAGHGQDVEEDR